MDLKNLNFNYRFKWSFFFFYFFLFYLKFLFSINFAISDLLLNITAFSPSLDSSPFPASFPPQFQ